MLLLKIRLGNKSETLHISVRLLPVTTVWNIFNNPRRNPERSLKLEEENSSHEVCTLDVEGRGGTVPLTYQDLLTDFEIS